VVITGCRSCLRFGVSVFPHPHQFFRRDFFFHPLSLRSDALFYRRVMLCLDSDFFLWEFVRSGVSGSDFFRLFLFFFFFLPLFPPPLFPPPGLPLEVESRPYLYLRSLPFGHPASSVSPYGALSPPVGARMRLSGGPHAPMSLSVGFFTHPTGANVTFFLSRFAHSRPYFFFTVTWGSAPLAPP